MRVSRRSGVAAGVAIGVAGLLHAQDAASRLAAARAALGADRLLAPKTTFVISGTQLIDTRVAHRTTPFEIQCELPDKFVWREESSGHGPTILGFARNKLIANSSQDMDLAVPTTSQPGRLATTAGPVSVPDDQQLGVARGHFTVITLGLFATSFDGHRIHASTLPGPNAGGAAIGISSDDGFGATMIFDPRTQLPDRLLYGVKTADMAYVTEWKYSDYRDVEGRRVPFRFAYSSGIDSAHLELRWVYQAESVRFNVPIDPAVFLPRGK
jgi:hypothetical protein